MKKKILSLLLAFVLCAGLSVPAFAEEWEDIIAIENGICTIQVNAWGHLEITNATSIGTLSDGAIDKVVVYTTAPTMVSMLNDVWGDSLGAYCYEVALDGSGGIDWSGMYERPIEIVVGVKYDTEYADEIRYDAGAAYVLEPGIYSLSAAMDGGIIVVVNDSIAEVPSSWAADAVNSAIAAGIVPDALQAKYTQATTRAEFCALAVALYETATGTEITERQAFSDTSDINVQKMGALGVVTGVGDGNFAPDQKLTREQAATMLARLANAMSYPMPQQSATSFADSADISSWALEAVAQIQAAGIMSGVGENRFAPADDYTREQSILTMMRLFDFKAV